MYKNIKTDFTTEKNKRDHTKIFENTHTENEVKER